MESNFSLSCMWFLSIYVVRVFSIDYWTSSTFFHRFVLNIHRVLARLFPFAMSCMHSIHNFFRHTWYRWKQTKNFFCHITQIFSWNDSSLKKHPMQLYWYFQYSNSNSYDYCDGHCFFLFLGFRWLIWINLYSLFYRCTQNIVCVPVMLAIKDEK